MMQLIFPCIATIVLFCVVVVLLVMVRRRNDLIRAWGIPPVERLRILQRVHDAVRAAVLQRDLFTSLYKCGQRFSGSIDGPAFLAAYVGLVRGAELLHTRVLRELLAAVCGDEAVADDPDRDQVLVRLRKACPGVLPRDDERQKQ